MFIHVSVLDKPLSYELLEDPMQAIEWLMQLLSVTPTDPHALAKLGELHDTEGDKSQAFQYYYEVKKTIKKDGLSDVWHLLYHSIPF